jgi:hypothetical protein
MKVSLKTGKNKDIIRNPITDEIPQINKFGGVTPDIEYIIKMPNTKQIEYIRAFLKFLFNILLI